MKAIGALQPERLAVFAGAGISLDPPSLLPDGGTFMREVLRRIAPEGIDPEWVASAMQLPETPLRRPGEFVRFETLMHELQQNEVDPDLYALDCFDACTEPNDNHFLLADLIRRGAVVVTTNFDRLIEIAWSRLFGSAPLAVSAFDDDFPPELPSHDAPPVLWKIHGSLSVAGRDTRASVQATIASMLSGGKTRRKASFVASVVRERDLLIVGYSGLDDLDMIPVLANAPGSGRMIWIDHRGPAGDVQVRNAREVQGDLPISFETDAVGRDRMWFTDDPGGRPIRDGERTFLVTGPTRVVLEQILSGGPYPVDESLPKPATAVQEERKRYFDGWRQSLQGGQAALCRTVAALFSLRRFRPDVREKLEWLGRRERELRTRDADPAESLDALIEEHNQALRDLPEAELRTPLTALKRRAEALPLSAASEGVRLRLIACIVWTLEGREAAAPLFEKAAGLDRERGDAQSELATLVTWRGYAGFGPFGDAIPPQYSRRIDEIAGEIGYLPLVWEQEILRHADVIDDSADLKRVYVRIARMRRYAVDVGEVRAEALSGLQIGRLYLLDQQLGLAIEEFLRVLELNRLLNEDKLQREATYFLKYCTDRVPGYAERMLPWIRRSMWAGRDGG